MVRGAKGSASRRSTRPLAPLAVWCSALAAAVSLVGPAMGVIRPRVAFIVASVFITAVLRARLAVPSLGMA